MKKTIDGTEYTIIPIPPHLSPYSTRISELLQTKPQSLQETDERSKEIDTLVEKLLSKTVKPNPAPEHQLAIFNALIDLTNATIAEAQFFRSRKGSQPAKSNATRPNIAQASQRDPES